MENKYDLNNFVNTVTEQSVLSGIVKRVKERRKEIKLTQQELAQRSGVNYASIRRFERTGEISFNSLLKIANVLNALADFNMLFGNEIVSNFWYSTHRENTKQRKTVISKVCHLSTNSKIFFNALIFATF